MPHPCNGCHLFETRGICPPARDVLGLPDRDQPDEELKQAIRDEAGKRASLDVLIQVEMLTSGIEASNESTTDPPSPARPALPSPWPLTAEDFTTDPIENDRKERDPNEQ